MNKNGKTNGVHISHGKDTALVTGGAGFVGTNLAARLLSEGRRVIVLDNLSRRGVEQNVDWLKSEFGTDLDLRVGDIRDEAEVRSAVADAGVVFHFAAQVAVTTSLTEPCNDFDVNARGTLNVLEAVRTKTSPVPVIFTSTNKVYGGLEDLTFSATETRYEPKNLVVRAKGIGEDRPLDFHSPYGCSKGCADQYVVDYARTMGVPGVVFRMSCIYGPHQFGNEDQGWVAHFLIQALEGRPITIYGDGKQVRDVLFVEDLVNAFLLASKNAEKLSGQAFNIGGGPENTTSLLELLDLIEQVNGKAPNVSFKDWRPGDQRYYVSDWSKFAQATGWAPKVGVKEGVARLYEWLSAERKTVQTVAVGQ